jgi:peptidase E
LEQLIPSVQLPPVQREKGYCDNQQEQFDPQECEVDNVGLQKQHVDFEVRSGKKGLQITGGSTSLILLLLGVQLMSPE